MLPKSPPPPKKRNSLLSLGWRVGVTIFVIFCWTDLCSEQNHRCLTPKNNEDFPVVSLYYPKGNDIFKEITESPDHKDFTPEIHVLFCMDP